MSVLDKVISVITPTESPEERAEARAAAQRLGNECEWLASVIDHHRQIEEAFAVVARAADADGRRDAQKRLAILLTGHALAEEAVLYPAMALRDQKSHATAAYTEQSGAKIDLAALETMDPMSQDYLDKLDHVKNAVAHHVYEEENTWFSKLAREGDPAQRAHLNARYAEEFDRYMGQDSASSSSGAATHTAWPIGSPL